MDCVFCDPEVTELAFLESQHFRCIYNKSPILPGYSMVISKDHRQSLFNFNDVQRNELMQLGTNTAELVIDLFDADSFNWTIQDRPPAKRTFPMRMYLGVYATGLVIWQREQFTSRM